MLTFELERGKVLLKQVTVQHVLQVTWYPMVSGKLVEHLASSQAIHQYLYVKVVTNGIAVHDFRKARVVEQRGVRSVNRFDELFQHVEESSYDERLL